MNNEFWINRWNNNETGWHQSEVEPALIKWAKQEKPCRIFVPLCGKSLDLLWLIQNEFEVIGVELSHKACEDFFTEHKIDFLKTDIENFQIFKGKNITIYNGDFFKLNNTHLNEIRAIYDRASLIALPLEIRKKYTDHLLKILQQNTNQNVRFLQILLTREPFDMSGPPYSVSDKELRQYYDLRFSIELINKEEVAAKAPVGSVTYESIYWMQ